MWSKALLNDIATEELGHMEMVATMANQLMKNATIDEIKAAGLESIYEWVRCQIKIYFYLATPSPVNASVGCFSFFPPHQPSFRFHNVQCNQRL